MDYRNKASKGMRQVHMLWRIDGAFRKAQRKGGGGRGDREELEHAELLRQMFNVLTITFGLPQALESRPPALESQPPAI